MSGWQLDVHEPIMLAEALGLYDALQQVPDARDLLAPRADHLWITVHPARDFDDELANYGPRRVEPHVVYTWEMLAAHGGLRVRLNEVVLTSREAVIAVLGHECAEIERLRRILVEREGVRGQRYAELVRESGRMDTGEDNLHSTAWWISDRLVDIYRRIR